MPSKSGWLQKPKRILTYQGKPITMQEAAILAGMNINAFRTRIYRGMTVEQAIETPVRGNDNSRSL